VTSVRRPSSPGAFVFGRRQDGATAKHALVLVFCALAEVAAGSWGGLITPASLADRREAEVGRLLEAGKPAAALALYPLVVADRSIELEGRPLALADALEELGGRFYSAPGAGSEARQVTGSLLRRALDLRRTVPGRGDLSAAETLEDLSTLAYQRGGWRQAEVLEQQALAIFRRRLPAGHPRLIKSLGDLGRVYFQQGRFGEAEPLLKRAVAGLERAVPPDPLAIAEASNALAELYRAEGRYEVAEALFRRGLAFARKAGDVELLPAILGNLAGVYRDQNRFEEVEPLLAEALALRERRAEEEPEALAGTYLNQADVYRLQGRYEDAEELAAKALAGSRRLDAEDPNRAWFFGEVALVATERGEYRKAAASFSQALTLAERFLPAGHPQIAQVLDDYGRMLRLSGRYREAEEKYRRALAIRRGVYGENHPETASSLTQLARCRALEGDDEEALKRVREALGTLAETRAYPDVEIDALALQAEILKRWGKTEPALAAMTAALEGVEKLRPHTGGDEGLRAEFLGRYVGYFNEMVAWQIEAGHPARAFETAERARARVLLDQLAAGRVDLRRGIPSDVLGPLEKRGAELRALLAEYQQRLARLPLQADLSGEQRRREAGELERQAGRVSGEYQRSLDRIRSASPLWREVITLGGRPVTVKVAQRDLLSRGELLLLYQVGRAGSFLFVVPPAPETIRVGSLQVSPAAAANLGIEAGPLTAGKLEQAFSGGGGDRDDLLGILESHGSAEDSPSPASQEMGARRLHALWQVLIPEGLWPRIRRASEAVVVPDGALHRIPFEALVVDPAPGGVRYWLDDGPVVRYAPSATALHNLRRRVPAPGFAAPRALVVTDPDFERWDEAGTAAAAPAPLSLRRFVEAGFRLPRLPGTAEEGRAILRELTDHGVRVTSLSQADAEEARVRLELRERPRFVHFATHALVNESHELLAALALTPPLTRTPGLDDDGFLQLFEIYQLDLDSALVVLSACRTQVGRRLEGEGVFALSRGFLAAGSERVVASLWPVNDDSTAHLMADFYRRIGSGQGYALALRDARRTLRREPRWSAPYYWGPFVLSGLD
jgi:tetratricopeptide (TPR) repeat protein